MDAPACQDRTVSTRSWTTRRWAALGCILAGGYLLAVGIRAASFLAVAVAICVVLLGVTQLRRSGPA